MPCRKGRRCLNNYASCLNNVLGSNSELPRLRAKSAAFGDRRWWITSCSFVSTRGTPPRRWSTAKLKGSVMGEANANDSLSDWFWSLGVHYLSRALALYGLSGTEAGTCHEPLTPSQDDNDEPWQIEKLPENLSRFFDAVSCSASRCARSTIPLDSGVAMPRTSSSWPPAAGEVRSGTVGARHSSSPAWCFARTPARSFWPSKC